MKKIILLLLIMVSLNGMDRPIAPGQSTVYPKKHSFLQKCRKCCSYRCCCSPVGIIASLLALFGTSCLINPEFTSLCSASASNRIIRAAMGVGALDVVGALNYHKESMKELEAKLRVDSRIEVIEYVGVHAHEA